MLSSTTPLRHDPWCSCRTHIQYLDLDDLNERSVPVAFRPLDSMLPEVELVINLTDDVGRVTARYLDFDDAEGYQS